MKLFRSSGSDSSEGESGGDPAGDPGRPATRGSDRSGGTEPARTEMIPVEGMTPVDDLEYPLDVPEHERSATDGATVEAAGGAATTPPGSGPGAKASDATATRGSAVEGSAVKGAARGSAARGTAAKGSAAAGTIGGARSRSADTASTGTASTGTASTDTASTDTGSTDTADTQQIPAARRSGSTTSATVAGDDTRTTAIPVAGTNDADPDTRTRAFAPVSRGPETGGLSAVDAREPLPYGEVEDGSTPVTTRGDAVPTRRGTTDLGLALLRLVLAVMLGLRGAQKLFGLFGSGGGDDYAQVLGDAGFQHADILATAGGVIELLAAFALLVGLATPVAVATLLGGVGLGLAVRLTHSDSIQLLDDDAAGLEPTILYIGALLALLFTGPGRWSADRRWRWSHSPRFSGFLWLVVAAAVGVLVWYLLNGTNPLTSTADSVPQPAR